MARFHTACSNWWNPRWEIGRNISALRSSCMLGFQMKNCTTEHKAEMLANGYVLLRGLLSESEVEHYRTEVHRIFVIHGSPTNPLFRFSNAVQREPAFAPLLSCCETLRIVYEILGPFMHLISSE